MTDRRRRKPCPTSGKDTYRDEPAALWAGHRIYRRSLHLFMPDLFVYQCPGCGFWHLTSSEGTGNVPVPEITNAERDEILGAERARQVRQARARRAVARER